MSSHDPHGSKGRKPVRKRPPRLTGKKLDHFLASICESAGMTGKAVRQKGGNRAKMPGLVCRAPCRRADWRAHLDVSSGVLCVSADWSTNKSAEKHRDVTIAITYLDEEGRPDYADMVFCDSEVRWLLETLWHAPIWEH